ncbi:MAG TPA: hypothetical protein VG755_06400 [Nannocystaceae bacterium]|nr:hypothetical protein [Nannocystaceae bacterium]
MPRARLLLGCFAIVGCFAESNAPAHTESSTSGDAETTTTTSGDSTATTGTTSTVDTTDEGETRVDTTDGGECGEGERPTPPLPAEWQGPFVLFPGDDGNTPPECPDVFVPAAQDVATVGPHAMCRCDCALGCLVDVHAEADCSDPASNSIELTPENCTPGGSFYAEHTGRSDAKECTDPDATLGETQWAEAMRVCGGDQQAACVPVPAGAIGPCIRAPGEHACPDGLSRQIISAADAELACDTCTSCVEIADLLCAELAVGVHTNEQCTFSNGSITAGGCYGPSAPALRLEESLPPECDPATAFVQSLVDAQTFCCVPD